MWGNRCGGVMKDKRVTIIRSVESPSLLSSSSPSSSRKCVSTTSPIGWIPGPSVGVVRVVADGRGGWRRRVLILPVAVSLKGADGYETDKTPRSPCVESDLKGENWHVSAVVVSRLHTFIQYKITEMTGLATTFRLKHAVDPLYEYYRSSASGSVYGKGLLYSKHQASITVHHPWRVSDTPKFLQLILMLFFFYVTHRLAPFNPLSITNQYFDTIVL